MKKLLDDRNLIFFLLILILPMQGNTCTDFILKSLDNAYVVGRSMEFGEILPTQIHTVPRGIKFQSLAPHQKKGMSWTNQYAYMGMVVNPANALVDGFNEKGLSVGGLWLPGTQYPEDPTNVPPEKVLFFADLGSWLLGNFSTTEEAKRALSNIYIYASYVPGFSYIPPIHLAIHDATGKNAVVEFIEGKVRILDNPIGVLTNAPEFQWHVTNLRNYISLSAFNAGTVNLEGTVLEPMSGGSGLLGIPGDWTSPSRFVRAATLKRAIITPRDSRAAVLAAIHLLNTVDISYGIIRSINDINFDFTQWVIVKDLTNKNLYYRTYGDQNIYKLNLRDSLLNPRIINLQNITP